MFYLLESILTLESRTNTAKSLPDSIVLYLTYFEDKSCDVDII